MTLLEPVRFDVVVASWLEAERHSPRFRRRLLRALASLRLPARILEQPDLASPRENRWRRQVLQHYRSDLWRSLPARAEWWRATITPHEFRRLRVINYPTWTLLSRHTGRLSAAAAVINARAVATGAKGRWAREARAVTTHVRAIRDRMRWAALQRRLILLGQSGRRTWTILEGNKRAAGLYIRTVLMKVEPLPPAIHVLVGLTEGPCACLRPGRASLRIAAVPAGTQ